MSRQAYLYKGFIKTLSERFAENLSSIQYVYGFDAGPEFENAICRTLRSALPQRCGICRGHVVDRDGNQAGDDIVIMIVFFIRRSAFCLRTISLVRNGCQSKRSMPTLRLNTGCTSAEMMATASAKLANKSPM